MRYWQISSLTIRNLFSYSDQTFTPKKDITSLVFGENHDDPGADSNGSGKSSLFDAVTWAIWGKTVRSENFELDILRRGETQAQVILILFSAEHIIKIDRKKGDKTSLGFYFYDPSNGWEDMTCRTVTLTQKAIIRFFEFDEKKGFDDYLSQVYFSAMSGKGFLSSDVSPAERQAVLERILNLNALDKARDLAKEDLKVIVSNAVAVQAKVDSHGKMIADIIEGMDGISQDRIDGCQAEIDKLTLEKEEAAVTANKVSGILISYKTFCDAVIVADNGFAGIKRSCLCSKKHYEKAVESNKEALEAKEVWKGREQEYFIELGEREKIRMSLSGVQQEISNIKLKRTEVDTQIKQLDSNKLVYSSQKDKAKLCPHCKNALMVKRGDIEKFDLEAIEKELLGIEDIYIELDINRRQVEEKLVPLIGREKSLLAEKEAIDATVNVLLALKREADEADSSEVDVIVNKLKELEPKYLAAEKYCLETKKAMAGFLKSFIGRPALTLSGEVITVENFKLEHDRKLSDCKSEMTALEYKIGSVLSLKVTIIAALKSLTKLEDDFAKFEAELIGITEQRVDLDYWIKTFPEIKRKALGSFIPLFEVTVNQYLSKLEISERVRFVLESDTKKKTIKPGFVIEVFDGTNWARFNSYSGGEKSRILVSVGFALRELASYRTGDSSFGFLLCDELLDNLDATGMGYFFGVLKDIPGQRFIITHTKADEIGIQCDESITIVKSGGESKIKVA